MRIASVATALPAHRYSQEAISACLARIWADRPEVLRRLEALHANLQVDARHLALPLERYADLRDFGAVNDAWIGCALDLGERAIATALERAGLAPKDVDALLVSTVTGVASPSLDARLANRMGLRSDIKRVPLFGLGCVAGAATLARAADYVRAFPDQVAVVLCVELCSLTLQRDDVSVANLISTGLFGDGAAAAVVVGARRTERGPHVLATRSVLYPDSEDVMGWRVGAGGFRIVLSASVPAVAREFVARDVDAFLGDHGLSRGDIAAWVCHPGGPKVLAAVRDALELRDEDLALSWSSLRSAGNLSSASVLLILEATLRERALPQGAHGLVLAMGPGFCSELVLLRW